LETPTALAVRACRMALKRAGIMPEQLGLILGDRSTALYTVPAEAQLVAGTLRLKIPAYDTNSGGVGLPFFLNMLSKWRPAAVPEYVLCFSTNAPTLAVNYSGVQESCYFGDGAGAAVVSFTRQGKLRLAAAYWENDLKAEPPFSLPLTEHLKVGLEELAAVQRGRIGKIRMGLSSRNGGLKEGTKLVEASVSSQWRGGIGTGGAEAGVSPWNGLSNYGEILGSAAFCVLSECWEDLGLNEDLCVMVPGVGLGFGGVLFSRHE